MRKIPADTAVPHIVDYRKCAAGLLDGKALKDVEDIKIRVNVMSKMAETISWIEVILSAAGRQNENILR